MKQGGAIFGKFFRGCPLSLRSGLGGSEERDHFFLARLFAAMTKLLAKHEADYIQQLDGLEKKVGDCYTIHADTGIVEWFDFDNGIPEMAIVPPENESRNDELAFWYL